MDFEAGQLLLVDKPKTWTSFDVVNKIRYALTRKTGKKLKVGHAGTLDPLATGLLIICTGKMTKRIDEFAGMDKEYTGTIYLGATTPTYDSEMEPDATYPTGHITPQLLHQTLEQFKGPIQQMPPVFSAVKIEGEAAYVKARKGKGDEVALKPRAVVIHQFELTNLRLPEVDFTVMCSKGTYIRSLAFDYGKALQSGAYLQSLCRTQIGPYLLANARTLPETLALIENANA